MSRTDKWLFFRQSGWMVIATTAGGVFMLAVHIIAGQYVKPTEYSVFTTLLRVFLLLGIPAGGLQTVFAQQSAAALEPIQERQLNGTTRAVLLWTFLIWVATALCIGFISPAVIAALKISNPAALWFTVVLGLASLWLPVLKGLLQGTQNFAGLGWVLIWDGVGRFMAIAVITRVFHGQAAGAMLGALIGQSISFSLALWFTRRVWVGPGASFRWQRWLANVLPLTCSAGAILFMSNFDVPFVQAIFAKSETPMYMGAAMTGFAVAQFIMPMAVVMFPKIAKSAARAEKSDAFSLTLKSTAIMGSLAAVICTLVPWLPLRIIYLRQPIYWEAAPLVPWFVWGLLIITLGNVLVSNLMARRQFAIVPWLVLIALAYGGTLLVLKSTLQTMPTISALRTVIQLLGGFNLVLLAVAIAFTKRQGQHVI